MSTSTRGAELLSVASLAAPSRLPPRRTRPGTGLTAARVGAVTVSSRLPPGPPRSTVPGMRSSRASAIAMSYVGAAARRSSSTVSECSTTTCSGGVASSCGSTTASHPLASAAAPIASGSSTGRNPHRSGARSVALAASVGCHAASRSVTRSESGSAGVSLPLCSDASVTLGESSAPLSAARGATGVTTKLSTLTLWLASRSAHAGMVSWIVSASTTS